VMGKKKEEGVGGGGVIDIPFFNVVNTVHF
jgi:hypothetical protein